MVQATNRGAAQEAASPPDAAPPATAPVAFEAAMQFGGTVFGVAVLSMRVVLADGRVMRLDLPTPAAPPQRKPLTEAEADVLEVVETMPVGSVWSVARIVEKAGWEVTTEVRQFLQSLPHLIVRHRLGWERAKDAAP